MKAHVGGWPGLHRFSLWNGIFYVQQSPARRPGLPSILDLLPAPEQEPARQPAPEPTLQAEAGPEPDYDAGPEPEPDYETLPQPEPEPDYETLPQPEPYYQPEPDANPDPGPDPWPARTAPPDGYAYEFGTGRLVLAALNPATGLRGYSWSRY